MPSSSSAMLTFTPLGVGSEYSCSRSGWAAGHLRVMGKALRSWLMGRSGGRVARMAPTRPSGPRAPRSPQLSAPAHRPCRRRACSKRGRRGGAGRARAPIIRRLPPSPRPAMFSHIDAYAGDPILSLNENFQKDPRPGKINLSIGIYFDDAGRIPVMGAVAEAERLIAQQTGPKPYLPMEGLAAFRSTVQTLLFGEGAAVLAQKRVATVQTVGSSGGLKVGADFIARWFPGSGVFVSDPTWDNHKAVFEGAGLTVGTYPYSAAATGGLRFDAMLEALRALPPRSVVLLHACCHNPTGVDLTAAQWEQLVPVLKAGGLLPFLDLAYQGFGDGIEPDAFAVRALADAGLAFFVANSFSKSLSVYGERAGALRAQWAAELDGMRERIQAMRQRLHDVLAAKLPGRDFGYFLTQRGMFSYTGLSPAQVDRLREEFGVYLVRSGRMCVAGLNNGNVEATANAMAAVLA